MQNDGGKEMVNYTSFKGKLFIMTEEYPIYDRKDDDKIIGYTSIGDMAVITYENMEEEYFETVIVSGKYIGVDTLALNLKDIKKSTFVFNKIDGEQSVCIRDMNVDTEWK